MSGGPDKSERLARIADLRQRRVRTRPSPTLDKEMDRALGDLKRQRRSVAGCAAAWNQLLPPELAERTALEGVSRAVLTVRVPDAATRFNLDRFLRAGAWQAFQRECRVSVRSVRIMVGD